MTPEQQQHRTALHEKLTAANWPLSIELLGGPYCGAILAPYEETATHVCLDQTPGYTSPNGYEVLNDDNAGIRGPMGVFRYRRDLETGKWLFVPGEGAVA